MIRGRGALVALVAPVALIVPVACTTVITLGGPSLDGGSGAPPDAAPENDGAADAVAAAGRCVALPIGTSTRTIQHGALTRTYEVVRSADVDACATPRALFGFHGLGADVASAGTHRDAAVAAAARAHVLAIFVYGSVGKGGQTGWACAGCADFEAADDIGLIAAIIDELGLDRAGSVAFGGDVGGSFVHRLVAELPLAAGAVLGGAVGAAAAASGTGIVRPTAKAPARMILEHSESDPVFPYNGGKGDRGDTVTSFPEAVAFWREANGCLVETPATMKTPLSSTQTFTCGGNTIVGVKWTGAQHAPPITDPGNSSVGLDAVLEQLLVR